MGRTLTFHGRLPGVVVEAALPPREDPLRMDVAGFVGFAERGPLDIPVALHDVGQYASVFGGDVPLARARQGNTIAYANLPGAVKAFFDNGGQRCYVVRVADQDTVKFNYFRIPGMLAWDSKAQAIRPVTAPAAWAGSWSANMGVGTQLLSQPLRIASGIAGGGGNMLGVGLAPALEVEWPGNGEVIIHLELPTATTVQQKDVLRLRFGGLGKPLLFAYVTSTQAGGPEVGYTINGIQVAVGLDQSTMQSFTEHIQPLPVPVAVSLQKGGDSTQLDAHGLSLDELLGLDNGYVLSMAYSGMIRQSEVLQLECLDGELLLFPVEMVEAQRENARSAVAQNTYRLTSRSPIWMLTPTRVERLRASDWETVPVLLAAQKLEVRMGQDQQEYVLHLDTEDAQRFKVGDVLRVSCTHGGQLLFPVADIWLPPSGDGPSSAASVSSPPSSQSSSPPDAGDAQAISEQALWLFAPPGPPAPSSMAYASSPPLEDSYGKLLEVDLLTFDLYVHDGDTVVETWSDLRFGDESSADSWLNVLAPPPDELRAEIAHPQVPQRDIPGLDPTRSAYLGRAQPILGDDGNPIVPLFFPLCMEDLPRPDEFAGALRDENGELTGNNGLDSFADPVHLFLDERLKDVGYRDLMNEANAILNSSADVQVDSLVKLHSLLLIDEIGLVALPDLPQRKWPAPVQVQVQVTPDTGQTRVGVRFIAPKRDERDWSSFAVCYQPVPPPPPTPDVIEVPVAETLPIIETPDEYSAAELQALITVQHALVNFCAARADVVGVLSLPLHFKRREVLDWQQMLTGLPEFEDGVPLSYVAVYHPWLQEPVADGSLRWFPPDGAICGMIAAREVARGPWIAPANVALTGVVGLGTMFTTADWADLFNAQVNLIRQVPGQFTLLSAHTLSLEDTFLQLSVRRLLIFLRKLALLRGMRYVFESNNERFRARVQASFQATLNILVERGAITAFEVVTGSQINTQNDYDNGRFLIAIRVAPTLPIEFITVVLLRIGEGLLEAIEV